MRIVAPALVALVVVAVPAACAGGGADRDETRRRLVGVGFTDAQAGCLVEAVFGLDDDLRDELTEGSPDLDDAQEARLDELLAGCGVAP